MVLKSNVQRLASERFGTAYKFHQALEPHGIKKSAVYNWMKEGGSSPDLRNIDAVAVVLGVPVSALFERDSEAKEKAGDAYRIISDACIELEQTLSAAYKAKNSLARALGLPIVNTNLAGEGPLARHAQQVENTRPVPGDI